MGAVNERAFCLGDGGDLLKLLVLVAASWPRGVRIANSRSFAEAVGFAA